MKLRLFNPLHLLLLVTMAFALSACGTMQKPVSTEDYVQSARAQVGAVYQTIGDLKAQGSINQAQTVSAIAKTEKVEAQVDNADKLMKGGDVTSAQGVAKLALAALLEIQATLPKPKGK